MESILIDILACPLCRGKLLYIKEHQKLICRFDRLAYPIRDGVPVMLEEQAKKLAGEEYYGI